MPPPRPEDLASSQAQGQNYEHPHAGHAKKKYAGPLVATPLSRAETLTR